MGRVQSCEFLRIFTFTGYVFKVKLGLEIGEKLLWKNEETPNLDSSHDPK